MKNLKLFLRRSIFIPALSSSFSFLFLLLSLHLCPDSCRDWARAMKSIIPLHRATRPVWSMIVLIITATQPPPAHCWSRTAWGHRSRLPCPIKSPLPNLFTHKKPSGSDPQCLCEVTFWNFIRGNFYFSFIYSALNVLIHFQHFYVAYILFVILSRIYFFKKLTILNQYAYRWPL